MTRPAWLRAALAMAAVGWGAQQFTPLLLQYQARLGLSSTLVQATFVPYVLGLMPGLLFGGPCSDRFGRRRVMAPTMAVSALATALLMLGGSGYDWLLAGRLLSGVASGAGFSCGAAWLTELSTMESAGSSAAGPRRITVAMTIGFGLGPLVSGALAQWAPLPTVLPYAPHLLLAVAGVFLVLRTPETLVPDPRVGFLRHLRPPEVRGRRFRYVIAPLAPWVFIPASVAVAYLPGLVHTRIGGWSLIFSAVVTTINAGAGILVQPLAKRVDRPGTPRLIGTALGLVVLGMVIAATAAALGQPVLVLVTSLVLGSGYGCCQVCGLLEVRRLADPDHLAGVTATYQAISYLGFVASYPLAAIGAVVPAALLLCVVAALAVLTLAWTTRTVHILGISPDSSVLTGQGGSAR